MLLTPEKNFVAWNTQNLDTYHDIIVSFDYARYSFDNSPTGGFCVVFFESESDVPAIGGPGSSLGYTPSETKTYCYLNGFEGLGGGFLGVGFDLNGEFAKPTSKVDGISQNFPNTCTIRGAFTEQYRYIDTSKNLFYTPAKMLIAKQINSLEDREFYSVRVIISKAFTNVKVQIKRESETAFFTVLDTKIKVKPRTAVRAGITTTSDNTDTRFDLKNFNVAGFPGVIPDPQLTDCVQTEKVNNYIPGNVVVSELDFCAVPVGGSVDVYKIEEGIFKRIQTIQEEEPIKLIGGNDKFLFLAAENSYNIYVYFKISNNFLKTQIIDLSQDIFDENVISLSANYPVCADTDNRFLAVGNNNKVFIFNYITGIGPFGFFSYFQTIQSGVSSIGNSVQIDGNNLLTGGCRFKRIDGRYDSMVLFYEFDGFGWPDGDSPTQLFNSPITGNPFNEFGYQIALRGNEAIISAPNERRRRVTTEGQGEVYHYVFRTKRNTDINNVTNSTSRFNREWRVAMELGSFYNIDSPGGNFGYSIAFLNNNLIASAPYENFLSFPDLTYEDKVNVGRVYIFRKNRGGTFSQAAIISPGRERSATNMYFGKYVGLCGSIGGIATIPYNLTELKGEIDFYKIGCLYPLPPRHIDIGEDSIALYDNSGYTIDIESFTYLQLYKEKNPFDLLI